MFYYEVPEEGFDVDSLHYDFSESILKNKQTHR